MRNPVGVYVVVSLNILKMEDIYNTPPAYISYYKILPRLKFRKRIPDRRHTNNTDKQCLKQSI
jgi:hypothetical protein